MTVEAANEASASPPLPDDRGTGPASNGHQGPGPSAEQAGFSVTTFGALYQAATGQALDDGTSHLLQEGVGVSNLYIGSLATLWESEDVKSRLFPADGQTTTAAASVQRDLARMTAE